MRIFAAALAALTAALPATASADDLSTFLAGRWGQTDTNWQAVPANRIYYSCDRVAGGPDTAMTFTGPLGAIVVTTNYRTGSSAPLSAPLLVGKSMKYDGNIHSGHLQSARLIVEIDFMRRGMFDTAVKHKGFLGIVGPDRFNIAQPGNLFPYYFARCPR